MSDRRTKQSKLKLPKIENPSQKVITESELYSVLCGDLCRNMAKSNGSDKQKRPITIIGLEGSANKIGIGIVRDGQVNDALIRTYQYL